MKVLSKTSFKQIMFLGENFHVPEFVKYVAVDASGLIVGFASKPKVDNSTVYPMDVWIDPDCNEIYEIGQVEFEGEDWKFQLTEV